MFNAIVHEMMSGHDKLTAVRRAYCQVYLPGLSALFTDGIGFSLLFIISIGVIQDIAIGATLGLAGCASDEEVTQTAPVRPVKLFTVEGDAGSATRSFPGSITASQRAMSFGSSGRGEVIKSVGYSKSLP